jgi:hypothetical protein
VISDNRINLNAVFWDYPQYREEQYLRMSLSNNDNNFRLWVARRFLEYGRAIDALSLFSQLPKQYRSLAGSKIRQVKAAPGFKALRENGGFVDVLAEMTTIYSRHELN